MPAANTPAPLHQSTPACAPAGSQHQRSTSRTPVPSPFLEPQQPQQRGDSNSNQWGPPPQQPTAAQLAADRDRYLEKFAFPYCGKQADKYEKVAKIGQGTFGEVFKARSRTDPKKIVALKRVLMENEKEGFPITALREIRILQQLNHENIVNLIEICRTYNRNKTTFYLVFDFCEHDLAGLLSNVSVKFTLSEIKKVMQQIFEGLYYIHYNKILHRDMKAANILITKRGILKLADFGLARAFSIKKDHKANRYTNRVVTLWYRPPELLLGERHYGPPVDMWGAGCVMAEMWTRSPIMQGNTEQHQLTLIGHFCGTMNEEVWPGVSKLDLFRKLEMPKDESRRRVKERLRPYVKDQLACDLIDKLLILDPSKRLDADSALNHDLLWSDPMPCSLEKMLANHHQSMFEYNAPTRRGARGGMVGGSLRASTQNQNQQQQQQHQQPQQLNKTITNDGYVDRVF